MSRASISPQCPLAVLGLWAGLTATMAAADLGPPRNLTIHPDGAILTWNLDIPAAGLVVSLPATPAGSIAVEGAAWSIAEERDPAPPAPAGLLALLDERNRLDDARAALAVADELASRNELRLTSRLPGFDPALNPAGWLAAIDAAVASRAARETKRNAWGSAQGDLVRRAEAVARGGSAALLLSTQGPVSASDMASAWAGAATPAPVRRLHLDRQDGGRVMIRLSTNELRWTPAAAVIIKDGKANLIRRAVMTKPLALSLPAITCEAVATNRTEPLRGPEERPIRLAADTIANKRVVTITSGKAAGASRAELVTVAAMSEATGVRTTSLPKSLPVAPASDLAPERWSLGTIALPREQERLIIDLPAESLTIAEDRWELAPLRAPIAQRHATIPLSARGLQPGPLTIVVDGRLTGSGWFQGAAPGTTIDLCLEEDPGIFVEPGLAWKPGEGDRTTTRHKEGWTWNIHHLGTQRRTVFFLASSAISRLGEVTVTILADTSPGSSEPSPGLRAWGLDLSPGASTAIGLGWVVTSSDGFKLR